ncbi:MAG: hypothetical protein ABEJ93_02870 [Candidatus Nanohalobium sp.]
MGDRAEKIRGEKERLEDFFGIEVDMPELERTHGVPELRGEEYDTLRHNSVAPGMAVHEMRHKVHRDVIEGVVSRQEEKVQNYFEGELEGLGVPSECKGVPTGYYSLKMKLGGEKVAHISPEASQDSSIDEVYQTLEGRNSGDLTDLIFAKNANTDIQAEVFAENSGKGITAMSSVASLLNGLTAGAGLYGLAAAASGTPETAGIAVLTAGAAYSAGIFGKDAYYVASSEGLTEQNLEGLSKEDRRRAMLYNSQVEEDISQFLETLDSYGIEG